jgi:hypothetical protein
VSRHSRYGKLILIHFVTITNEFLRTRWQASLYSLTTIAFEVPRYAIIGRDKVVLEGNRSARL